jgi:hypothetical protein
MSIKVFSGNRMIDTVKGEVIKKKRINSSRKRNYNCNRFS